MFILVYHQDRKAKYEFFNHMWQAEVRARKVIEEFAHTCNFLIVDLQTNKRYRMEINFKYSDTYDGGKPSVMPIYNLMFKNEIQRN